MKRYYLLDIVAVNHPEFGTVYKNALQAYMEARGIRIDYQGGQIGIDPSTGLPTQKVTVALVGGIDHARLRGAPGIVQLPNVSHDMKVSAIQTGVKLAAKAAIKALGVADAEVEAVWSNSDGFRDILNYHGRSNDPAFDVDNFDIDES